jgi:hypothetical protein
MNLFTRKMSALSRIDHPALFYGLLFFNLILLTFSRFYPSVDGPAHLYNANLLAHFLKGDEILEAWFTLNNLPIANWTSHLMIAGLHLILPGWLAEKVFLMLYIAGMACSFRYLVSQVNPGNIALSLLVFPFIHTFLFYNGFYNFSISIIFIFFTIAYFFKAVNAHRRPNLLVLMALLTVTCYTNLLAFFFLGLTLGSSIVITGMQKAKGMKVGQSGLKKTIINLLLLLLASLPGLIGLGIFLMNTPFGQAAGGVSIHQKIVWLLDLRPLIVFHYINEEIFTRQYFLGFVLLFVFSLPAFRAVSDPLQTRIRRSHLMLIPVFAALILFFITPNSSGAGMMSDRYLLLLFVFVLIWISYRTEIKKPERFILVGFVIIHLWMTLFLHMKPIVRLARNADTIYASAEHIEPYNLVLPVNLSDSWLETHFSNYLGSDKPMIILENYEARVGWFPLKWNPEKIPTILLGDQNSIPGVQWVSGYDSSKSRQIDVVFLYGRMARLNDADLDSLKHILDTYYTLAYRSDNDYARVYRLKNE